MNGQQKLFALKNILITLENFRARYRRLTLWNKIGFWGSLASLIGLLIAFFSFQETPPLDPAPKVQVNHGVAAGRDIKGSTITIAPLREGTHDTSIAKEN